MLKRQLRSLQLSIFLIVFISFSIIGAVFLFHAVEQVPLKELTRDITATGNLPIYTGVLSQLGIFIWISTAAVCLFSSLIVSNKSHKSFLLTVFAISLYLGLDDAFLFHEVLFPGLGIHQKIVIMAYGLFILLFLWKFRKTILITDFLLLGIAFICFSVSVIVDNLFWESSPLITNLLEDGAKFIGLVTWVTYFGRTSLLFITNRGLEST